MNTITEIEAAMVKADKLFVSGSIRNDKSLNNIQLQQHQLA